MQTLPDQTTYNSIVSGYYRTVQRVVIGATTYASGDIISMNTDVILYDDFGVGNAISGQVQIVLAGIKNIALGETITVQQMVKNETDTSSWFNRGVFFVYKATKDQNGKTTTIDGYDALYKTDVPFMKTGTWTSQTTLSIVSEIATEIGVTVHSDTLAMLTNSPIDITYLPNIGENGTTSRQLLSYFAVMYGGNWIIDPNGYLKMVVWDNGNS